jgi:hypothetical protein
MCYAAAIYMWCKLIQRHRITAPLVNSTLDYVLWSDSCSGHFNQLRTYAPLEWELQAEKTHKFLVFYATVGLLFPSQIRLAILSSSYLQINITRNKASFTLPSVVEKRPMQMWFVAKFSCCVPAELRNIVKWYMSFWFFILAITEKLCGWTENILLLKGPKHQLSLYDKMPALHFSSDHVLLQKVCKHDDK